MEAILNLGFSSIGWGLLLFILCWLHCRAFRFHAIIKYVDEMLGDHVGILGENNAVESENNKLPSNAMM